MAVPMRLDKANKINLQKQMEGILWVLELMEKGARSTSQLVRETGFARETVIKYREEAINIQNRDMRPLNVQAIRNMEIGRLHYWIDTIQKKYIQLSDTQADRDYGVKLLGRLDNMQSRLHAITGLNTDVHINYDEKKRIVFVMNGEDKRTPETLPNK